MAGYQIEAYKGSEDYIFVSYAHKDSSKVFPIIKKLKNRGYRIWYDEGISPGSEWPEDIALHLNSSAMVIAFVSPRFMDSVNCRREINFALSRQKPFLSVVLEPTEMPLGMEMQLSTQQSVLRHNYATEEMFIEKICAFPGMNRCNPLINCAAVVESPPVVKPPVSKPAVAAEDPEILRQKQLKKTVSFYGNLTSSVSSGIGAVILAIVTLLLFGNYHQDNLAEYTLFQSLPEQVMAILPNVWHALPDISSPEFRNPANLPGIVWLLAFGRFLRGIGGTFKHHDITTSLIGCSGLVQCAVIVAHLALCARLEMAAPQAEAQWQVWMEYYFPVDNLIVIAFMAVAGHVVGRAVDRIVRKILSITLKTNI